MMLFRLNSFLNGLTRNDYEKGCKCFGAYLSAYDKEHVFEGMCKMKEAAGKLAEMFEQEETI